ncbi:hypothetical protein FFF34_001735 [Inquilinus sp. KBS0705]|nr:hypothetical protein FFF34_001735 [Inquilinus sp. KBS0705]
MIVFYQRKGKGGWVLGVPLIVAIILFIIADALSINDKYIGVVTLFTSAIILFMIDNKRATAAEGDIIQRTIKLPRQKRINTLMWIEVRYWAMILAVAGVIALINMK